MKKTCFLLFLTLCSLPGMIQAQEENLSPEYVANKVMYYWERGEYPELTHYFSTQLESKLNANTMKVIWLSLVEQSGDFEGVTSTTLHPKANDRNVVKTLQFEKAIFDLKMGFDSSNQVVSFIMKPSDMARVSTDSLPTTTQLNARAANGSAKPQKPEKQEYRSPSYVFEAFYTEKDLNLKSGNFTLPAKLTLPKNGDKFPIVILVHGSGPNDMDETIGPNKMFADLAGGLSTKGIAVLRYNKRTLVYGAKFAPADKMTVEEETIEDVLAAINLAKTLDQIDPSRIYILGHSLGGMLAPRIAKNNKDVKGIIMMAAPARSFQEVLIDQVKYITNLDKVVDANEQKQIDALVKQVNNSQAARLTAATPKADLPFGLPPSYWMDLNKYDQVKTLKELKKDVLILHAKRDYQVPEKDWDIWFNNFNAQPNVKTIRYVKLNHIFMDGEGMARPEEYMQAGNVADYVIKDITEWIKLH